MHTHDTLRVLNRLIRTCRDSEEFCRMSIERVAGSNLRTLLRYRSEEWGRFANELQALVLLIGGDPATTGTLGARVRHMWFTVRRTLFGTDERLVLHEWRSLQRHALRRYQEALRSYLPERARRLLALHADRIEERRDQLAAVRERSIVRSQSASGV